MLHRSEFNEYLQKILSIINNYESIRIIKCSSNESCSEPLRLSSDLYYRVAKGDSLFLSSIWKNNINKLEDIHKELDLKCIELSSKIANKEVKKKIWF